MNAPDVYDAEGRLYEDRRHGSRRADDIPAEVVKGWELWAKLMFLHRGKVMGIAMTIAGLVSYSLTAVGMRYVGPRQDMQAVERKIDTLAARVTRVEGWIVDARREREDIRQTLAWVIYMQCVSTRRTDPNSLPPICEATRRP